MMAKLTAVKAEAEERRSALESAAEALRAEIERAKKAERPHVALRDQLAQITPDLERCRQEAAAVAAIFDMQEQIERHEVLLKEAEARMLEVQQHFGRLESDRAQTESRKLAAIAAAVSTSAALCLTRLAALSAVMTHQVVEIERARSQRSQAQTLIRQKRLRIDEMLALPRLKAQLGASLAALAQVFRS